MRRKKDFTKLPESELQIMQLIWDMDKKGVKDIHAGALLAAYPDQIGASRADDGSDTHLETPAEGLHRLEKHGRANCAIVLADENEYKRRAAKDFVETVYKNNTKGLISALYSDGILSEDDIADLRKEIDADKK